MVDYITVALAAMCGLGVYLVGIPFVSFVLPARHRKTIGDMYGKQAARLLQQFTYVRRVLSGYDILTIDVDSEKKLLEVTLDSSTVPGREDKTFRFANPDDRIKRLFKKPVAMNFEEVPAAVDAELAETGHWVREKDTSDGLVREGKVDPYVSMPDDQGLHIADPLDAFELVPNSVTPENITTTEKLTERRFDKYGDGIGMRESLATILGFATGAGFFILARYVNDTLLHGTGGGGLGGPIDLPMNPGLLVDLVVIGL